MPPVRSQHYNLNPVLLVCEGCDGAGEKGAVLAEWLRRESQDGLDKSVNIVSVNSLEDLAVRSEILPLVGTMIMGVGGSTCSKERIQRYCLVAANYGTSQILLVYQDEVEDQVQVANAKALQADLAAQFCDQLEIGLILPGQKGMWNVFAADAQEDGTVFAQQSQSLSTIINGRLTRVSGAKHGFLLSIEAYAGDGEQGTWIARGTAQDLKVGSRVKILPGAQSVRIDQLEPWGETNPRHGEQWIKIAFVEKDIGVGIGDWIVEEKNPPQTADQFRVKLWWLGEEPLLPQRKYQMVTGRKTSGFSVTNLKSRIDWESQDELAAQTLTRSEIGVCNIAVDQLVPFTKVSQWPLGSFFKVQDPETHRCLGVGSITFALRRSHNLHWQAMDVTRQSRSLLKGHKPCILWFTGLSGSGKSAIANRLEQHLSSKGVHTFVLDGDNVRHGLNKDLGFTQADRIENNRRVGEVARLMGEAGLVVIVSFISPFASERHQARNLANNIDFFEVFIDTPLSVAEKRDVKGLYAKARRGEIDNFTGISSPYEAPQKADIHVDTVACTEEEACMQIVEHMGRAGIFKTG